MEEIRGITAKQADDLSECYVFNEGTGEPPIFDGSKFDKLWNFLPLIPTWHPYPAERPEEDGWVLCTTKMGVSQLYFDVNLDCFEGRQVNNVVIAWMPLPTPYNPPKEG